MRNRESKLAGCEPEGEAMPENRAYGCLFCTTGKERAVAWQLERVCPEVRTMVARQEKHRTVKGQKSKIESVLLPGYVFFDAPVDMQPYTHFPWDNVIRVLTMDHGVWQLTGEDRRFAAWLFRYDGLLCFSRAYQEGDRIRIISGPLKDLEGSIKRIDRRGRSGQVCLTFNGRTITTWLGFDLVDSLEQPEWSKRET